MPPRPIIRRPAPSKPKVTPSDVRTKFFATVSTLTSDGMPMWHAHGFESAEDAVCAVYPPSPTAGTSEEASWKTRSAYGWYKLSREKAENSGVYLPLWEKERTKIQNMSVSVFKSKYDFKMPIEEDDDGRERKYLDSVKDIWITDGTEMKSFLEAKYYLRGARRSANESLTWAGKFGSLKPEKNDSDYGEDLGDEEDEGEEEEGDEGDEATAA